MGPTRDVEIAKFLAEQAEAEAKREAGEAAAPEWRWSRTGWGEWGGRPPELSADALTPPEPNTGDATKE
jgi:hypothetical protein